MATKLIQLQDGTLVEVEVAQDQAQQISGRFAAQVETTIEQIRPTLIKVCRPIIAAWNELSQEMHIDQAEVELGLSFEAEGNLYVAKSTLGANVQVKLVLKP